MLINVKAIVVISGMPNTIAMVGQYPIINAESIKRFILIPPVTLVQLLGLTQLTT